MRKCVQQWAGFYTFVIDVGEGKCEEREKKTVKSFGEYKKVLTFATVKQKYVRTHRWKLHIRRKLN